MRLFSNTVQEPSRTNWSASSVAAGVELLSGSPVVSVRFTGWSLLARVGDYFYGYAAAATPCRFTDCQFSGGKFTFIPDSVALTNCLWERVRVYLHDYIKVYEHWYWFNSFFAGGIR